MVAIFILDRIVYPGLRRFGFNFTPLRRIAVGFLFMTGSIVLAGIIEIERKHSINSHGTITQDVFGKSVNASTMNVFYQVPQYIFHGTSEALALITGVVLFCNNNYKTNEGHMETRLIRLYAWIGF